MKVRNKKIFSSDQAYLRTIADEYTEIGYDVSLTTGELTIFARRRRKPKPKREEKPRRRD